MSDEQNTKPAAATDPQGRLNALVSGCDCEYQHAKPWGYQLWRRGTGDEYWETVGRGALSTVKKAAEKIDAPILVKCRGCGREMLREYDR